VDDIYAEVIERRQPLSNFLQMRQKICCKPLLNFFVPLLKVVSRKRLSYDDRRELQAERKFNKLCDIIRILKTLQTVEIMSRLMFNPEQKILSKLQRHSIVEHTDISDPSEQICDFYTAQSTTVKKAIEIYKKKKDLTELDQQLLLGIYTNDFNELKLKQKKKTAECKANLGDVEDVENVAQPVQTERALLTHSSSHNRRMHQTSQP
jgi:hypothetical protein